MCQQPTAPGGSPARDGTRPPGLGQTEARPSALKVRLHARAVRRDDEGDLLRDAVDILTACPARAAVDSLIEVVLVGVFDSVYLASTSRKASRQKPCSEDCYWKPLGKILAQHLRAAGMTELGERLGLNLADALPGNAELPPDLLERARMTVG